MHARKGKRGKKKLSEIWCDMHVFVLYVSVDAALGKLESKIAGIYLSLTSYYCCWAIAKVKLGGRTCMKKAGYNPSPTCINIRARHVEEACM